jgi:diguanylate cyclase (GGDEF)-like protein
MSAAAFVLTINLFIAAIFAISFGVVAAFQRSSDAARWLSAAYGLGVLNVGLEFLLPFQTDPRLVGSLIFLDFLVATGLLVVGTARHYRVAVPWRTLALVVFASSVIIAIIIGWPRESFLRMMLYQGPYALMMLIGAWVIWRSPVKRVLDYMLLVLFVLCALQFLGKPFLAAAIGSGARPQDYMASRYAAFSQTLGAFLLLSNGLLLLLILVRDLMEEMTARSETDRLSGLFNRRGFEDRVNPGIDALRRSGLPGAMLIADLDHFKRINDAHGHEAGDEVIAAFAETLRETSGDHFVLGRLGGEEFAVFLPGVEVSGARLFAESVRVSLENREIAVLAPGESATVSIGVAQIEAGDRQSDALRRADGALYEAKRDGRNRVAVAPRESDAMPDHPFERRGRRGRRPAGQNDQFISRRSTNSN